MFKVFPSHVVHICRKALSLMSNGRVSNSYSPRDHIKEFETSFARYIGGKSAFSVSSGRAALILILRALDFKKGTEIIIADYNFPIIPAIIRQLGLKPVFIDINAETHNMEVSLLEELINKKTGAVLVTHLFGQPCDLAKIMEITVKNEIILIEDCAHACGSEYRGKKAGSFGAVSYFSFGLGKSMPCFGGGLIITNNETITHKINKLYSQLSFPAKSWTLKKILTTLVFYLVTNQIIFPYILFPVMYLLSRFNSEFIDNLLKEELNPQVMVKLTGEYYRMAKFQAFAGLTQLKYLDQLNSQRISNAKILDQRLAGIKGLEIAKTIPAARNIYLYYRLLTKNRKEFRKLLLQNGIDSKDDCMTACSSLPFFRNDRRNCPVSLAVSGKSIEIPCNSFMTEKDVNYIADQINKIALENIK